MNWTELVLATCATFATPQLPDQMAAVASAYGVDPALVLAVVWTESRCDPSALGRDNDSGLMQVIPKWHGARIERLGVTDLFDPVQNMTLGVDLLVDLGAKKDLRKALATYNGGPGRPAASYRYADAIITLYQQLKDN